MEKNILLFVFLQVLLLVGYSQSIEFAPSSPQAGDTVDFIYVPLEVSLVKPFANVYFHGNSELTKEGKYPKVLVTRLSEGEDTLKGTFIIPKIANGFVVVVLDSLGNVVDNNRGEGFSGYVYDQNLPVKGSRASHAEMYFGGWNPEASFNLVKKRKLAKSLYEQEFMSNPDMKKEYIRFYLNTLTFSNESDRKTFIQELVWYSKLNELSEWDYLNGISFNYAKIGLADSAEKYRQVLLNKFPRGSWSSQLEAVELQRKIRKSNSFEEKVRVLKEFDSQPFPYEKDEFTKRILLSKRSTILSDILIDYIENGKIEVWFEKSDSFSPEFKANLYSLASKRLLQNKAYLDVAESLVTEAIDIREKNFQVNRSFVERPFYTDNQITNFRMMRIAEDYSLLGQIMLAHYENNGQYYGIAPERKQTFSKESVASTFYKSAVEWGRRNNPQLNHEYISFLYLEGYHKKALKESKLVIELSKGTPEIEAFYSELMSDSYKEVKESTLKKVEKRVKDYERNLETPAFIWEDEHSDTISLQNLEGKINIIDFWASWCPPCIEGFEVFDYLVDKHKANRSVQFLFVNVESDSGRALKNTEQIFIGNRKKFNKLFVTDPSTLSDFFVYSVPTKVIIDKDGKIRYVIHGAKGSIQDQLEEIDYMIELLSK